MDYLDSVERRLWFFSGQIFSACGLGTWAYSDEGVLYTSTSTNTKEFQMFFAAGGCKDYALTTGKKHQAPFIMSDSLGLIWVGEYVDLSDGGRMLVVLGPVFYAMTSVRYMEKRLKEMDISIEMQRNYMKVLMNVPVIPMVVIQQYAKMLHFTVSNGPAETIYYQYELKEEKGEIPLESEESQLEDWDLWNRTNQWRQMIKKVVREGDMNYKKAFDEMNGVEYMPDEYDTDNVYRTNKNMMIILTFMCSQAAIEGGLPPQTATALERHYIRRVEDMETLTELQQLNEMMIEDFIQHVKASREMDGISPQIRECCEYVKANFMKELTLKNIAKAMGYTEYYLSRKFQQEMGIRLLDYIKNVRLEYAKVWLLSTDKSIQEISEQLRFGTRNYFTRVFKEKTGKTPAAYRDENWGQAEVTG